MKKLLSVSLAFILLLFTFSNVRASDVFQFNDPRLGPISVATLDWLPGNGLAVGAVPLATSPSSSNFNMLIQSALGNFIDSNNQPIQNTGLNIDYEITVVMGATHQGSVSKTDTQQYMTNYYFNNDASINYFKVYYDKAHNSNNLTGTGFNDGVLILSGTIAAGYGSYAVVSTATYALDNYNTNNYPEVTTLRGAGGYNSTIKIDYYNPQYITFTTYDPKITFDISTSTYTPFSQVDPSATFFNGSGFLTPIRGVNNINGMPPVQGQADFQFQVDASSSSVVCGGSIGNFVWHDLNNNGYQDTDEPGINNVQVTLKLPDGSLKTTTTTNDPTGKAGYYQFNGLCSGNYTVDYVTPTGFTPTTCNGAINAWDPTVSANQTDSNCSGVIGTLGNDSSSNQSIDFGFVSICDARIGDYVWSDDNGNGIQDPNETGLNNVNIKLTFPDGTTQTTTTGPDPSGKPGYYQFTGLCAGAYTIDYMAPTGFTPTTCNNSPNAWDPTIAENQTDGNCSGVMVPLDYNSSNQSIDFGFKPICEGKIGDYVWSDDNGNGIQDPNETGLNNVNIKLTFPNGTAQTTTTGPDPSGKPGYYQFTGLCEGAYTIDYMTPTGFTPTTCNNSPNAWDPTIAENQTDSNCYGISVPLGYNSYNQTIDFGFKPICEGKIGDFVWSDDNANGTQDSNEPGINNVLMRLILPDGSIRTTTTGPNPSDKTGYYQFTGLCAGTYTVDYMTPTGFTPTTCNNSPNAWDPSLVENQADSNCYDVNVPISYNSSNQTIDFGFYQKASLGDRVWDDKNGNGIQDMGEPGIAGVRVELYSCADILVADTNTDANGIYNFTNLTPGSYYVVFSNLPSGYSFTTANAPGSTEANDSDADTTGKTNCVTLASGDHYIDLDGGTWKPLPSIDIEKYTNGEDADTPTGPIIPIGGQVKWTYVITNTGNVELSGVTVTDDKLGPITTCPKTVLAPLEAMTCTAEGTAVEGQYTNLGTASGTYGATTVTDTDPSYYLGGKAGIDIRKQAEGPDSRNVPAGSTVSFEIAVTNTGNVPLDNVIVTDQLVADCARTIGALAAGQTVTYTCNASPVLASFTNTACAVGNYGTSSVNDCDTSTVTVNIPKIDITKYISIDGNTWLHTDSTNVMTVALCSTCEEDYDKDHCDYNHDNKCDEKDIDYCKSNKYDCDKHDSEHGSSKRHYRCDDSSNKPDCDGKAREAHERDHSDYNNDGKCDERDIDYCSSNKSTCDRHDTDHQSTKRSFRCDDSSSKTWCENKKKEAENSDRNRSDYNHDNKCDERDVDFCKNNKYTCDQFDKDRGNLQRRFRCDDSANWEQCEGTIREEHEKERSDYNNDGKCDERDIDFCMANRSDCDEHDKNLGNLKRSHKCDDSSDKATCEDRARQEHDKDRNDYNRDGKNDERDIDFCNNNKDRCVKHDRDHNACKRTYRCDDSSNKESCDSYAQREHEKDGSDYNHDGKCDERDINYCKGDQERCDKHDQDHGQSKRAYRCDDSSNKEYCYSYALREHDKDRSDYNRDGKCDERDIDFCKGNQDECIKHDKDRGNFKRSYRCDDSSNRTLCETTRYAEEKRDKDLSDYNRDGKCNERDIDYCKYNSYACNKFDSDRGNKKRTYRCDDSYDKSSCESKAQWEHQKDCGDYNHDGKDDEHDIEHCKNNPLSCDRHDRDHGDSKRNYRCDDSSDKTRCEEWAHGDNGGETGCNGGDGYSTDCGKVYFKFVVTNTGTSELTDLTLTDNVEDLSSCVIPATLQPNGSFSCIIGPQTAQAGLHVNTATATGTYAGILTQDTDQAYYFGCTQSEPLSPGYWKNHPESWPVESITIGGTVYTKTQAIELMGTPVSGDKTYTLFKALVAAKLDAMGCGDSSCVTETIANADAWMAAHPVGSGVPGDSSAWMQAEPWYLILDDYINGRLCGSSNSCTPPPTPAPTCGQCNGGATKLTIMNKAWSSRSVVVKDSNGLTLFSGTVASNNSFTFMGKGTNGTMGPYVKIYVDGSYKATIYTDCSKPIYPGMGIDGYFMVVEGYSLNGGKFCRISSSSCTDKDDYHYSKDYCDSHDGESTCSGSYNYQTSYTYSWSSNDYEEHDD